MEHAFGRAAPFALGMEEELLLVAPDTLALAHVASTLVPHVRTDAGQVEYDVYEALVELSTPIVADAAAGERSLGALRAAVRAAGGTLIGAGLHPDGAFGDVVHVDEERYARIAASMQGLLRRTPTCALHVHVGVPDPETAIACFNGLRGFLPVLQGLAAHSPYWHGRDSGFATARAQLFRGYPRGMIPPAFADWGAYEDWTAAWTAAAEVEDYTYLWWDLRPHPKLGTLELRAMDAQSRLASVTGLAALVHGLVRAAAEGAAAPPPPTTAVLVESSFRAGRDGLDATVWWDGGLRPVRELAAQAIALARAHLPDPGPLEEVERILAEGNGADRMRAAHARGGMPAVLAALAAEVAQPAGAGAGAA
jgi:carboxylate-amine ligase